MTWEADNLQNTLGHNIHSSETLLVTETNANTNINNEEDTATVRRPVTQPRTSIRPVSRVQAQRTTLRSTVIPVNDDQRREERRLRRERVRDSQQQQQQ